MRARSWTEKTLTSMLIKSSYCLGDLVVLSGAIRELSEQYPDRFRISVETGIPAVWDNNPHVRPLLRKPDVVIQCNEVEIDRDGALGVHYVQSYLRLFERKLGVTLRLTKLSGDIHLSHQEQRWYSEVYNFCGHDIPYWIVCSGGKFDIPVKWWSNDHYQRVVNHFKGRLLFVQVGTWGNHHPKLENTVDLRGRTGVRDLIHLVYQSQGVLSGVTSLMHLAAAVPTSTSLARPAVIVAGSREPASWERYPDHTYLCDETLVCRHCWYCSVSHDSSQTACTHISQGLPTCMDLIRPEHVIEAIETLIRRGDTQTVAAGDRDSPDTAVAQSVKESDFDQENINPANAVEKADAFLASLPIFPRKRYSGRGIVMCAGGTTYFACAWVCINLLRKLGCELPIELWHLGREEFDSRMEAIVRPLGVTVVNARTVMNRYPLRNPLGWELKSYAVLHSQFAEVLFVDADNVPVRNPEYLFESEGYKRTGAVFWPDFRKLGPRREIWKVAGVEYRREPEFESGQMLISKERCWRPLNLAFWYNNHSEFFFRYIHGDKETFHMAWRKAGQEYSMPPFAIKRLPGVMCQHDFEGRIAFQHRNLCKWNFFGANERIPGFVHEATCLKLLEQLKQLWNGQIGTRSDVFRKGGFIFRRNTCDLSVFNNVFTLNEYSLPDSLNEQDVVIDVGAHIGSFSAACWERGSRNIFAFEPDPGNFVLAKRNIGRFPGIHLFNTAILGERQTVQLTGYSIDGSGLNTGGVCAHTTAAGGTKAESLDNVLKSFSRVKLLKLDCEGSEWSILQNSSMLRKVELCVGEYHCVNGHTASGLKVLLKRSFRIVRVRPTVRDLGVFFARRG